MYYSYQGGRFQGYMSNSAVFVCIELLFILSGVLRPSMASTAAKGGNIKQPATTAAKAGEMFFLPRDFHCVLHHWSFFSVIRLGMARISIANRTLTW